ncbi:MAG: YbjN domain-containing protein [Clostridia bacterium]|nr:YbjN domain-containing protein [Clostridia bacterium]
MNDSTKISAREVYKMLINTIKDMGWSYEELANMQIRFAAQGNDIPMSFRMTVNEGKQTIVLYSLLPLNFDEDKRLLGALASCSANYRLADGSFDYDITDGAIFFRMTANYRDSEITNALMAYMIECSCRTVDRYNDKFLMLSRGIMTLDEFNKEIGFSN